MRGHTPRADQVPYTRATHDLGSDRPRQSRALGPASRARRQLSAAPELLWAPYVTTVPAGLLRAGTKTVTVTVSNSSGNHYEGAYGPPA